MISTFGEDTQGTAGEKEMVAQECRYKDHRDSGNPHGNDNYPGNGEILSKGEKAAQYLLICRQLVQCLTHSRYT